MKQFKSLNFTYQRLIAEVEMLTKQSIKLNSEFNTINNKVKDSKVEYKTIQDTIKEDFFRNKADIINYHKDYKQQIEKKEKFFTQLEKELKEKKRDLNILDLNLEKKKLELTIYKKRLNTIQRSLDSKSSSLDKKDTQLDKKSENIQKEQDKWEITLKEKRQQYVDLKHNILKVRDEEEKSKENYNLRMIEINQQKRVLELWENRLNEKEEKISSEMRTLISARSLKLKK